MADDKVSLTKKPIIIQVHGWYPIVIICFVVMLLTIGNIFFTYTVDQKRAETEQRARDKMAAQQREADRRWCALMVPLDDAYNNPATPPSTELGRSVARAVRQIRVGLGC